MYRLVAASGTRSGLASDLYLTIDVSRVQVYRLVGGASATDRTHDLKSAPLASCADQGTWIYGGRKEVAHEAI